jgi:APA family basic amino acid/polyamine antiporter
MAAMIPVSGSAYAYAYATMGEGIAWIMGSALVLDYAFGAGAVANGWSSYLSSLLRTLGTVPDGFWYYTKGPWELVTLNNGQQVHGIWNVPASLIVMVVASILYRGITASTRLNTIIVGINMVIMTLFILLGIGVISWTNLHANPNISGLLSLVPAREVVCDASGYHTAHYGWLRGGVLTGTGVVFFAFIGFDSVSTVAQETKNPKRDMPIGILGSLLVCTILYILIGFTLTGVVPYRNLNVSDPIALGIDKIVALRNWTPMAQKLFAVMVKLGALAGLTSVILVNILSQTRIFYAMSKDGLLPWFSKLHTTYRTPHLATIFTGAFVMICGGLLPIGLVANLVSLGTLLVFLLVCVSVPIMRYTNPHAERSFKVPCPWLVGNIGAIACLWVMLSMDLQTWACLLFWFSLGLGVYCLYGRRHSLQQRAHYTLFGPIWVDYFGITLQMLGLFILAKVVFSPARLVYEYGSSYRLISPSLNPVITALVGVLLAGWGSWLLFTNVKTKQ